MKMKSNLIFLVAFLLLFSSLSHATDTTKVVKKNWITPDFLTFQYAGNIGAYIAGAGYNIYKDIYNLDVMYGFTPKYKTDATIHTFCLMNTINIRKFKLKTDKTIIPFAGLGISVNFADGEHTFVRLPKQYPEGYYAPNAIRLNLNFGLKFQKTLNPEKRIKAFEFYFLTTTNDLYLKYYVKYRNVYFKDIFTLALGVNIFLF